MGKTILGRDEDGVLREWPFTVLDDGTAVPAGEHPDAAAHQALGLAVEHDHPYADADHAHGLPDHEHDYAEPHEHDFAAPHDHPYASDEHTHPPAQHPDLAAHTDLGLAAAHAHPYAASGHNHDGTYAVPHSHDFSATNHGHDGLYASAGHAHAAETPVYAALATTALALGTNTVASVSPTANTTYTTTVPAAGSWRAVIVRQTTATSRTITFGSGFKPVGTLATGTTSARVFVLTFVSDGTNLYEASRTAAIVA